MSPELGLLIACCRASFASVAAGKHRKASGIDWGLFLNLARFHRVQGLAWRVLASRVSPPAAIAQEFAADAAVIASTNLRAAAASAKLRRCFEEAGVPLLFVKGLTLGALAYGDAATKAAIDIDLLVENERLGESATLLERCGYRVAIPGATDQLPAWHRHRKESVWKAPVRGVQVDLHTRLADNPRLIPAIGLASPRQVVEVAPGIVLPTLGKDELFAYLAVHGASSAWFRLKWITDLAALVSGLPSAEIERLYRRSQKLGAGRAAAQALLLADRLYGTLGDMPDLKGELCGDRASRWLAQAAFRQVAGSPEPVEPTSVAWGTAAIHYTQLLLLPGIPFKASELVRQARSVLA